MYSVSIQRLFAAIRPPLNEVSIGAAPVRGAAKHMIVIAHEAAESRWRVDVLSHQITNHLVRGGPPVDIVAQEQEIVRDGARAASADFKQGPQLVEASVDVSNREGHAFVHIDRPLQIILADISGRASPRKYFL
jgi:hypothetical protein